MELYRHACSDGDLEKVKELYLEGYINIDCGFLLASGNNHLEVAEYLLEKGADIHYMNDLAIRWGSSIGNLEVVKYLVENGANLHIFNEDLCI